MGPPRDAGGPAGAPGSWRRRIVASDPRRALTSHRAPDARTHEPPDPATALVNTLVEVRAAVRAAAYPLAMPSARPARQVAAAFERQIEDYLIPRLLRLDGPLLAVVGGSTGAGKSTLVNSLVRAPISPAGVLRPTTRAPLLAGHPADTAWFRERTFLPRLARTATDGSSGALPGEAPRHEGPADTPGEARLQIVDAPRLTPGVVLVDAPDIDSVVAANRSLARDLLAAGDLWLFLTTAARYADAVPWRVLREARERGTMVAIILDRVSAPARDEVSIHFARMLGSQGLGDTGLFIVAESTLDGHGLLPEVEVGPVKRWLDAVAGSATNRRRVLRRTLLGAVAAAGPTIEVLADAAEDQVNAASRLAGTLQTAYDTGMSDVESALCAGAMLRGEVYARWRELVATGVMAQALRTRTDPRRTEVRASLADRPSPGRRLLPAMARAIGGLVAEAGVVAAQHCREQWRAEAAGRALLAADPSLGRPWPGFADAAHDIVHAWQAWLRTEVRRRAPRVRTRTRSYASAATVLLATIAATAPPADDVTASGVGPAMLRAVLADDGIRALGEEARKELLVHIGDLFAVEVERHLAAVWAAGVDGELAARLRAAAMRLRGAGAEFAAGLDAAA